MGVISTFEGPMMRLVWTIQGVTGCIGAGDKGRNGSVFTGATPKLPWFG